ncbi:sulfotransferase family protein [Crocosphaera watsonii]|uniref:sulfotransferase family protein n=1 Tax=Crocosphaera watsonii TaxID=263511 RepID=UPI000A62129D|nr:sulfotransferase family protein [Crocosphaera watsonii]
MNKQIKIPILYIFARSGGTLVNRCLGSISNNVVLSEINPYFSVIPMEEQAKNWFSLLSPTEYQSLLGQSFINKLEFIIHKANLLGKKLVIRDWPTPNSLGNVLGDGSLFPSGSLEQKLYLSHHGFETCPVVISRRSADVYESLTRTFKQFHLLSIDEFSLAYLEYAKAVHHYPNFHYEDICQNPDSYIRQICSLLEINYDSSFANNFWKFTKCTGDNHLNQPSRGFKEEKIVALESNINSDFYIVAMQNEHCRQADRLLGYVG